MVFRQILLVMFVVASTNSQVVINGTDVQALEWTNSSAITRVGALVSVQQLKSYTNEGNAPEVIYVWLDNWPPEASIYTSKVQGRIAGVIVPLEAIETDVCNPTSFPSLIINNKIFSEYLRKYFERNVTSQNITLTPKSYEPNLTKTLCDRAKYFQALFIGIFSLELILGVWIFIARITKKAFLKVTFVGVCLLLQAASCIIRLVLAIIDPISTQSQSLVIHIPIVLIVEILLIFIWQYIMHKKTAVQSFLVPLRFRYPAIILCIIIFVVALASQIAFVTLSFKKTLLVKSFLVIFGVLFFGNAIFFVVSTARVKSFLARCPALSDKEKRKIKQVDNIGYIILACALSMMITSGGTFASAFGEYSVNFIGGIVIKIGLVISSLATLFVFTPKMPVMCFSQCGGRTESENSSGGSTATFTFSGTTSTSGFKDDERDTQNDDQAVLLVSKS